MLCLSFREFTALTEVLQGDVVQLVNIREFTALTEVLQGDVVQLVNIREFTVLTHLQPSIGQTYAHLCIATQLMERTLLNCPPLIHHMILSTPHQITS